MANNPQLSDATANAEANAVAALLNSGTLLIYNGSQPANANTAVTSQTLLATLTFGATAFGSAVGGVATANAITPASTAAATGTASWFRCLTSGSAVVFDGTVGTSGCDLNINTTAIQQNAEVACTSFTFTAQET